MQVVSLVDKYTFGLGLNGSQVRLYLRLDPVGGAEHVCAKLARPDC